MDYLPRYTREIFNTVCGECSKYDNVTTPLQHFKMKRSKREYILKLKKYLMRTQGD